MPGVEVLDGVKGNSPGIDGNERLGRDAIVDPCIDTEVLENVTDVSIG